MDSKSQSRIQVIQKHFLHQSDNGNSILLPHQTAGEFFLEQGYSVVLPEKLQTGNWNVYRSALSPLKLVSRFPDHPEIATLHDILVHAVETYGDNKYLGTRVGADGTVGEYKWMTYREAGIARLEVGSGLLYHGIPKGSSVGLYFNNRSEWVIVDNACSAYSYISVPLYDTLGPDAAKFIVNHAAVQVIFCVPNTLKDLLSYLSEIPSVRLIVVVGASDDQLTSLPSQTNVEIITYARLQSQGHDYPKSFCPPKPEDIATICYTSGTTGKPKGAVLSHGNLIANVAGQCLRMTFYPSDIYISYLPLAHIYERVAQFNMAYYGVGIGFYQGDNLKLMDDMVSLRPTIFFSVPRVYNKLYAGITNAVKSSGGLKQRLFNTAYNAKKHAILNGKNSSAMWDTLVFNKIKGMLGGQVRFMLSAASPLSPDVLDFLRVCFGCIFLEAYGMTENSCAISNIDLGDNLCGHVGSPSPACEIKLVDVPEMDYTSADKPHPRGEICVRGPTVFQGYYKDEAQTRDTIDEDGWLHTGDIGIWLPEGRLKIIDRKKNIFKLAQGEYVAAEKIENVYVNSKFVAQCFVYGDSLKSSLVAVVSLDQDVFKAWAAAEGIEYKDLLQLCNDPRAKAAVLADMTQIAKKAQLRGFECVKAVTLVVEPFTMENGLLTPTFKLKRPQAKAYFSKEIDAMYKEISES
ncbi:long chain acyl-CoA synthetase 6, peroxisomal [Artemisia annua]|uniref:Long-chain-fatty-acid--CoA ligase n=1 Tax=Artemisia annua TaxID=35608 RepID=A0A2U1PVS5_ARTAN|nr:long chain acyl-CoA synthetase 6, peroxisomal [Artemisia annua]